MDRGTSLGRRSLLGSAGAAAALVVLRSPIAASIAALADAVRSIDGYGALGEPDEWGVRVPVGFTSELVARTGDRVGSTDFRWHRDPDGAGCFRSIDGHVLVSNSEVDDGAGGVTALHVDHDGQVLRADRILSGTSRNCAGGVTPWSTWLSCEENGPDGQVWECDPNGGPASVRPALGSFNHEAAAVDPRSGFVYLTEDHPEGRLYRFRSARPRDLSSGVLEAAEVVDGVVRWRRVDPTEPDRSPRTTGFDGGEGALVDDRSLLFATKGDRRIWEVDLVTGALRVVFDAVASPGAALTHVDNIVVHPQSHVLFVAEDGGDMELCAVFARSGVPRIEPVVQFVGHEGSEVTGPTFTPDGRHLYVTSQRGVDGRGLTVRVSGPWIDLVETIVAPAEVGRTAVRQR